MKHTLKITMLLLSMFFLTQIIGLAVLHAYMPDVLSVQDKQGNTVNITTYHLPYGTEPPQHNDPQVNLFSIIVSLVIAVLIMFMFMRWRAEIILRWWFFIIITLAIGITVNAALLESAYSSLISLLIALPLAFFKVFKRNIIVHNTTELLIYPGIAAIFVPLLNIWTVVLLLIFISLYDMYAVWHTGFMQKMAKYQIRKIRIFSGFFIPYLGAGEKQLIARAKRGEMKNKKVKMHVAILGGGDVVFPIIVAGVVLNQLGLWQALLIAIGATGALAALFYNSEKGRFYPAMPFISIGCFIALIIAYIF